MEIYWLFEHDELCRRTAAACMPEYQNSAAAAKLKAPVIYEKKTDGYWRLEEAQTSGSEKSELKQVARSCPFTYRATLGRSGLSYFNTMSPSNSLGIWKALYSHTFAR